MARPLGPRKHFRTAKFYKSHPGHYHRCCNNCRHLDVECLPGEEVPSSSQCVREPRKQVPWAGTYTYVCDGWAKPYGKELKDAHQG